MEIMNAKELEESIHRRIKEEKFENMIRIQLEKIKNRMREGKKDVLWIFSDSVYYHNDMEKKLVA